MCHPLFGDTGLYRLLFQIDADLAAQAQRGGCPVCGGSLHSARYPRKPRGGPGDLDANYEWRLSFCCSEEGCRRRMTPPSVRFLGRRVYLGAVVVLITAMGAGVTASRMERLRECLAAPSLSVLTVKRWRSWWQTTFVATPFWRLVQGRFVPPVTVEALPASLLARFVGAEERSRLLSLLAFVCPLTTASLPLLSSLAMVVTDPQRM